jgi:hypothetical protein
MWPSESSFTDIISFYGGGGFLEKLVVTWLVRKLHAFYAALFAQGCH